MITKEQLAERLNGREYGDEITKEEEQQAKESGLVVLFGASDDLAEFRGAIHDEADCYDGGEIYLGRPGLLPAHGDDDCECKFCAYEEAVKTCKVIVAVWGKAGCSHAWIYKTDIPHATFEILEDGEKYCRGIVFELASL